MQRILDRLTWLGIGSELNDDSGNNQLRLYGLATSNWSI